MSDAIPTPPDYAPPGTQPPKGALLAIFLIVLSDMVGFGIIVPLLPFYAEQYSHSAFAVGLLFSVFSLCQLIATPILGLMSDRFGRRPVLLLSQLGSSAGYLLLGFASYVHWANPLTGLILIYISRALDGASGGNISAAQAYISDVTTPENRARGMGALGAAFGIGFTIGPAIGGILGHFHVVFPAIAAATLSFVAALQTYFYLKEARVHVKSDAENWLHPSRFKPILADRALVHMLMISFVSMGAFVMLESIFALFLMKHFSYGELQVGLIFAYIGVVIAVVQGRLIGPLTKLFGEWKLAIVGPICVALAMVIYAQLPLLPFLGMILLGGFLNATGRSLQTPSLSSLISKKSGEQVQGATFGLYHMLMSLARTIGPVLAAWSYGYRSVAPFLLAAGITGLAALWTVWLRSSVSAAPVPATSS